MWRTIVYTGHTDGVPGGLLHEMDCAEGCSSVTSENIAIKGPREWLTSEKLDQI